ncbi:MAG: chorismate synthase [Bacteroidales bacterium]|nr:chorismate synthase [Bacteroidales bacterium]
MNTFGRIYRISIFGESHGKYIGITIDGCPAGIKLQESDFQHDILRRKSGSKGTTTRIEIDFPEIISGVFEGKTSGSPITILFKNENEISKDYSKIKDLARPGHADFTSYKKFKNFNDYRGGGHFSGRLTLAVVAAGVIAKKIIDPVKITAKIIEAGGNKNIEQAIDNAIKNKESIGGIIQCSATNIPIGLGEPFFDSIESVISHVVFSIPAIKGIEFGSGFKAAQMFGSQHNDEIIDNSGKTKTNYSGGINGGITNGNNLIFNVAVKPTSSISKTQKTINLQTKKIESINILGRHDTCIALRVPVVIEAVTAIALADFYLINKEIN